MSVRERKRKQGKRADIVKRGKEGREGEDEGELTCCPAAAPLGGAV